MTSRYRLMLTEEQMRALAIVTMGDAHRPDDVAVEDWRDISSAVREAASRRPEGGDDDDDEQDGE